LGDWRDANHVGALAAACAEAGDFDAAVEWQSKALDLADEWDADFRERLEMYQQRKPYRDEQH
jgi:hypothetical protein